MSEETLRKSIENKLNQYEALSGFNIELKKNKITNVNNIPSAPKYAYNILIQYEGLTIKENILDVINELKSVYSYSEQIRTNTILPFVKIVFNQSDILFDGEIDIPWYIEFHNCIISIYIHQNVNNVKISNNNFKECTFNNIALISVNKPIKINSLEIKLDKQININQFNIHSVILNKNDNKIEISNTNINVVSLSSLETNTLLKFYNINNDREVTKKDLSINGCTFNNKFSLKNSDFSTQFNLKNVNFNDDVSLERTKVNQINFNDISFKSLTSVDFSGIDIANKELVNRSTFRKIKHFLEIENNKIEANRFHSYEMEARQRELQNEETSTRNILDKFIFFFNKQVSNHGLNWALPLFWMVFLGLYYSSILYSSDFNTDSLILSFILPIMSLVLLILMKFNDIARYVLALIPAFTLYIYTCLFDGKFNCLMFFKFLNITNFDAKDSIAVYFSKIIMAYLIYHLLMAFRKDTRR